MNHANEEPSAVGVFDDLEKAERTIDELRRAGFASDEIGIIGHVGTDRMVPTPPSMHVPEENVVTGFMRGGLGGCLVGTLVILVVPRLGEVTETGRWFEIIGGALLGAVVGGVFMAFAGLYFSRPGRRFMATQLEQGNFIVTVKNPQRKDEAVAVLRRQGLFAVKE
jgi:hypothetical protein